MLHESKLAGLAAISWYEPNLCFTFALLLQLFFIFALRLPFAFGDKSQPASIWRPAWAGSIAYSHGEAPGFTPTGGNYPD
jgi:hypothetical protein